ncbi:hypothetical protein MKX03_019136 [Papaver bracteatum]|nr:hypothetical protein MKX03_019136 [Papaver bracteatum]
MATETETAQVPTSMITSDSRGKHRIVAELKRLEQETRFLEKELEELERTNKVSDVLPELLHKVGTRPDALLPATKSPIDPTWDRWFEGPRKQQGCICCFFR